MARQDHNDTSTGDIAVELRGVTKVFRQRQRSVKLSEAMRSLFRPQVREVRALDCIDLQVRRGEVVAYAGANGAGKSTTVKMLSGMLSPTSGAVCSLGMDPVRDRVRYVRRIGVVFGQRTELWWDHPVAASYEWKRVVWDIPKERYGRMLELVKDLLGIGEFFSSLTRELSLGQRMRADLGLMLLHEPEILFLDEPTIGLDVLAKRSVLGIVKTLNQEHNVTVMVTSHDMSDLEQLAGRIVLIERGKLAFDGDFSRLRRDFGAKRRLMIETTCGPSPVLNGAEMISSEENRHEYAFDAAQVRISDLLDQASSQTTVVDVETHQASIDDVIADIYASWQSP